jgi:hypothetical protein
MTAVGTQTLDGISKEFHRGGVIVIKEIKDEQDYCGYRMYPLVDPCDYVDVVYAETALKYLGRIANENAYEIRYNSGTMFAKKAGK